MLVYHHAVEMSTIEIKIDVSNHVATEIPDHDALVSDSDILIEQLVVDVKVKSPQPTHRSPGTQFIHAGPPGMA